jgi:hypothetical protein
MQKYILILFVGIDAIYNSNQIELLMVHNSHQMQMDTQDKVDKLVRTMPWRLAISHVRSTQTQLKPILYLWNHIVDHTSSINNINNDNIHIRELLGIRRT